MHSLKGYSVPNLSSLRGGEVSGRKRTSMFFSLSKEDTGKGKIGLMDRPAPLGQDGNGRREDLKEGHNL